MKVVIVGGVAGGASAAARIRRLDEHAQIIMIERSGYVSYANCGLPYYVGGVIKEQEELTLQTPESFWDRFRIDVRVRQEVTAINPAEKTVTVHALDSGKVYTETYDKLLLAPGAKPTVPALSGVDSERVFTCAPWKTPSAFGALLRIRSRKPLFWLAAALSVWKWRKTLQKWVFPSPSSSVPSSY